jgi:DNA-binding response OmpR family regulator
MPVFSDSDSSVAPSNQVRSTGHHVLVVDDDAEIAESIKLALRKAGFEVFIAHDGNTCIAIAETKHPDLIILDLMMPKRSGFLVLERLRLQQQETLPVIVITGNGGNRHRDYAELLGVDDYIQKPFTMDRLIDSVKNLLPGKKGNSLNA